MAQLRAKYETVFLLNPGLSEEDTAALMAKFKDLIEQNATDVTVEEWGKRRLAYPINDLNEAHYVFITFESEPTFPAELSRIFKITDGVMRNIIVNRES